MMATSRKDTYTCKNRLQAKCYFTPQQQRFYEVLLSWWKPPWCMKSSMLCNGWVSCSKPTAREQNATPSVKVAHALQIIAQMLEDCHPSHFMVTYGYLAETVKAIQAIHLASVQPGAGNGRVTIPHTFAKSMHLHGMDPQVAVSESTNVQFSGMTPDISHLCGKQNQKPHGHHTSSTGLKRWSHSVLSSICRHEECQDWPALCWDTFEWKNKEHHVVFGFKGAKCAASAADEL